MNQPSLVPMPSVDGGYEARAERVPRKGSREIGAEGLFVFDTSFFEEAVDRLHSLRRMVEDTQVDVLSDSRAALDPESSVPALQRLDSEAVDLFEPILQVNAPRLDVPRLERDSSVSWLTL